ncbi:MAG: putative TetR-family transcriptional regulator [Devosia sp.]|uniref:TetR/AcrR family transcriptional regulator n=1 Tax=Devosia sp. TaxID=1871048 RepID=UPI002636B73F|nr:TetR/AcrR family transcriptional regulator [Devosia sp.]MDB5539613.1 putative TetR-family transcriptional regulator [Devosia sp.]
MDESESRSAIKQLASDLLIRHGYRGMGYAEIATQLGITRANIHYHFGSKAELIDEVLADYVAATLDSLRKVWANEGTSLPEKLKQMLVFSRQRYNRFNARGEPIRPWSLISRLRQDQDLLSASGRTLLAKFSTELHDVFAGALSLAAAAGEIRGDVEAATTLLVAIADSAAPITIAEGGFMGLEAAYGALAKLTLK